MGAYVQDPDGNRLHVQMGSYGIGVSRLVGAVIEASHDQAGIIWPEAVAPFKLGILNLRVEDDTTTAAAEAFYQKAREAGLEVLFDDRQERAGAKFAEIDLIGLPWQVAIGPRGIKAGTLEVKNRATGQREEVSAEAALDMLTA